MLQVKISEVDQGTKWQGFQRKVYEDADDGSGTEGDRERGASPPGQQKDSRWLKHRAGDRIVQLQTLQRSWMFVGGEVVWMQH